MVKMIECLLSTYYNPASVLSSFLTLAYLILTQSYDLDAFIVPILEK